MIICSLYQHNRLRLMRSLRPSPCLQPQGQALDATLRAAIAVQIGCPADLSLNHTNLPGADLDGRRSPAGCAPGMGRINYGYAFGPRIKYGAGSGTRWRQKSCAIIASTGEKCGLVPGTSAGRAMDGPRNGQTAPKTRLKPG